VTTINQMRDARHIHKYKVARARDKQENLNALGSVGCWGLGPARARG